MLECVIVMIHVNIQISVVPDSMCSATTKPTHEDHSALGA